MGFGWLSFLLPTQTQKEVKKKKEEEGKNERKKASSSFTLLLFTGSTGDPGFASSRRSSTRAGHPSTDKLITLFSVSFLLLLLFFFFLLSIISPSSLLLILFSIHSFLLLTVSFLLLKTIHLLIIRRRRSRKRRRRRSRKRSIFILSIHPAMAASLPDLLTLNLPDHTSKIIAEYVWIGGSGLDIRSKARTLAGPVSDPKKLPKWNYDGSSTGQAPGEDSEVILYPQAIFKDPFRQGNNILVICDAYTPAGEPIPTNKRAYASEVFSDPKVIEEEPWFGLEQEYTLLQKNVKWPLGWPAGGYPGPQGPYYCGVGADKAWGRDIVDAHYKACLYAGINVSGVNGEVMPGQWEFQVGPSVGIAAADQLWCARYILERITEMADVVLSLDPKPIEGDWNGAGCHTNFSTKSMRAEKGYEVIKKAIDKLRLRHKDHIAAYGEGNERRLTGKHETANINTFSWGVANRGASVRVGRDVEKEGKGYFEDRRPASNMDPYVVAAMIAATTILWEPEKA